MARLTNDELAEILEGIRLENGGELSPAAVFDAAAPEDHPLHDRFEWDVRRGWLKYNLGVARQVIRCVMIEHPEAGSVRRFHSLVDDRRRPEGDDDLGAHASYRPTVEILSNEDSKDLLLGQMLRELESFQKRYDSLVEFANVIDLEEAERLRARRRARSSGEARRTKKKASKKTAAVAGTVTRKKKTTKKKAGAGR